LSVVEASDVRDIPVDQLTVSRHQVRTRQVRKDLEQLVENIRVHGQLEPILVCPNGEPDRYEIIAGQRRWLAMKELGYRRIRAAVLAERVDEETARALSISENLVRHDVDSKDMIDACTKLYHRYGTVRAVAQDTGLPYHKVQSYVKFDRLRPELKRQVESGVVDVKTALKIEDYCTQRNLDDEQAKAIVADVKGLTIAQRADYFRRRTRPQPADRSARRGPEETRPGDVHQILVTLLREDHQRLRAWAADRQLTQDRAAAWIISRYFQNQQARDRTSRTNP
jgi:ParB family transcriptional regulator, chromosome partitioning protein